MPDNRYAQRQKQSESLKRLYRSLYAEILEILARYDPIGLIEMGAPGDEYALETGAILPRLREAKTLSDVERIVWEVMIDSFSEETGGRATNLDAAAAEIWAAYQKSSTEPSG